MWRYVCSKHSLRIFCFKRKLLYRSLSAMKVPTKKRALSFLPIIASLTEIACTCELAYAEKAQPSKDVFPNGTHFSPPQNNTPPWSEVFPSLNDVVSMARLSGLVYEFRDAYNFTCADFIPAPGNYTEDITCEWYTHSYTLGTQVLLVSNRKEKYIAVIFAGTDDLRTFLEDTNMITKPFGNNSTVSFTNETDHRYENVKVHGGFNNAVFTHDIWEQIYSKTQDLLQKYPSYRLWTTGHSLGAANAILTATAFASVNHDRKVLCVNFGCPRTGNRHWRDYFNSTSPLSDNLSIWRVVLSWDLIPRLPHFFYHVGHTIQIVDNETKDIKVYYEHYGDEQRGYAGVPAGWYSKSYAWLPYALYYHQRQKYLDYLEAIPVEKNWHKFELEGQDQQYSLEIDSQDIAEQRA